MFVMHLFGGTLAGVLVYLVWLLRREKWIQADLDRYTCETKAATSRAELEQLQEHVLLWQEQHPQCAAEVRDLLRYIDWRLKHNYPPPKEDTINSAAASAPTHRPG